MKKQHQFTKISDVIGYSGLLSSNEFCIYYAVKSHLYGPKKKFWASKDEIAKISGISSKTVQRIFAKWRILGYLTQIQANRFKPVVYQFNEDKMVQDAAQLMTVGRTSCPTVAVGKTPSPTKVTEVGQTSKEVGQDVHKIGQDVYEGRTTSPMNHTNIIRPNNQTNRINQNNLEDSTLSTFESDEILQIENIPPNSSLDDNLEDIESQSLNNIPSSIEEADLQKKIAELERRHDEAVRLEYFHPELAEYSRKRAHE